MSREWEELAAQIRELKRQLAEVSQERDQYKSMCELHDAQRDRLTGFRPELAAPYGQVGGVDVTDKIELKD